MHKVNEGAIIGLFEIIIRPSEEMILSTSTSKIVGRCSWLNCQKLIDNSSFRCGQPFKNQNWLFGRQFSTSRLLCQARSDVSFMISRASYSRESAMHQLSLITCDQLTCTERSPVIFKSPLWRQCQVTVNNFSQIRL